MHPVYPWDGPCKKSHGKSAWLCQYGVCICRARSGRSGSCIAGDTGTWSYDLIGPPACGLACFRQMRPFFRALWGSATPPCCRYRSLVSTWKPWCSGSSARGLHISRKRKCRLAAWRPRTPRVLAARALQRERRGFVVHAVRSTIAPPLCARATALPLLRPRARSAAARGSLLCSHPQRPPPRLLQRARCYGAA